MGNVPRKSTTAATSAATSNVAQPRGSPSASGGLRRSEPAHDGAAPRELSRSPTVQVGPLSEVTTVVQPPLPVDADKPSTPPTQQGLIDEVTDKLFAKFLTDAMDTVVELNRGKSDAVPTRTDSPRLSRRPAASKDEPITETLMDRISRMRPYLCGCVADVPARTDGLIHEAVQFLWTARSDAPPGGREAALKAAAHSPPEVFKSDWIDPLDLNPDYIDRPGVHFISRLLLFDLVAEAMEQIYAGEDVDYARATVDPKYQARVTSTQFRLWNGPVRPQTLEHLSQLVQKQVEQNLRLRSSWFPSDQPQTASNAPPSARLPLAFPGVAAASKLSRTAQWTLSKKSFLDGILELELRSEEGSWLSYTAEETQLKFSLYNQIWQELLHDALDSMIQCSRGFCPTSNSIEL